MNQRRGSLIIEILLSIGVLGIVSVMFTSLISVTNRTAQAAEQETMAVAFAKASMEELVSIKNTDWALLRAGHFTITRTPTSLLLTDQEEDVLPGNFRRHVYIDQGRRTAGTLTETGDIDANVFRATVTVSWEERGQTHQVQLVNYLTNWKGATP